MHQTPHTSPSRASYGVSFVRILVKNCPRYNDTALYIFQIAAAAMTTNTEGFVYGVESAYAIPYKIGTQSCYALLRFGCIINSVD